MGYSSDESSVRVDFFKPSGKWYATEAVKWITKGEWGTGYIVDEFEESLREHFKDNLNRYSDMDAVCLEPYHAMPYPLMLKNGSWRTR